MSKQIFKFGQPAEQAMADFIAANNTGFRLPGSELIFGVPQVQTAPAVATTVQGANGYRGVNVSGSVTLMYDRLDLAQYFQGVSPVLDATNGTDPADLLASLLNRYQLYFTADTTGSDAYSAASFSVNNLTSPPTVTMTAAPSNLLWQGSVAFILGGELSLLDILPNVQLSSLGGEPTLSQGQSYAEAYYGTNFNTATEGPTLAALGMGAIPVQTDATPWAIGTQITTDSWTYDASTPGAFNIAGAVVTYNGVAEGDWALSPALTALYTNVCVITLSTKCTNLVGNLIIPYNVTAAPSPSPTPL